MKNKIKNNIGMTTIKRVIMYLFLFYISTFLLDLIMLTITFVVTNHQLNYIATKLEFQGGFIGSSVGDNSSHWVNRDFYNYLNGAMAKLGIDGTTSVWGLDYYPDYINDESDKIEICNTKSALKYKNTYVTPDRGITASGTSVDIGNLYKTSHLVLWFDYKYIFSGNLFKLNKVRLKIETDFKNEFIN